MYAYEDEEYNFYAEAHLPKIKSVADRKTGETVERKPHIHIFVPQRNLLSGKEMNPRGMAERQVAYFEAFQEYINKTYHLASPREHVRVDPTSATDVLSRYKGDDFRGRHQAFKKQLVRDVIDKAIFSRGDFYAHVASFGDTRVRHQGKDNEYLAVRLPGDEKFTNLKETIFQGDFIVRREFKSPLWIRRLSVTDCGNGLSGQKKSNMLARRRRLFDSVTRRRRLKRNLRSDLSAGRERRRNAVEYHTGKFAAIPGVPTVSASIHRAGYRIRPGMGGEDAFTLNMPPYARHPHQVTTIAQIQRRGTVLFGEEDRPLRSTAVSPVCRVMPKPDRNASFVAAYFLQRYEENQLHPAQRQDIRAIDTQFYAARRAIQCDERLTRNEKSQYVSILTFERLKVHLAIKHPTVPYEKEMPDMESADIRKLIKTPRILDNSISGVPPEDNAIPPARERFARLIQNLNDHMADKRIRKRQRVLSTICIPSGRN
ncbi:hypothetical protein SGGMMB4_05861 (plasmid) [Sodalis glossinidius str. 'morsitans']|uniref:Uncharacterized protein n=1 Tax=Sodalis glossinidius (strain morsitans) TaxID=343509 RepID=A0A193QP11_SODGM|nr:hypothetical protein [Sodalis glossinidius]CRL46892.1 hypothetical protein SGGMMB4_05861 [Sodalis glossinidius str. 'morsitans']